MIKKITLEAGLLGEHGGSSQTNKVEDYTGDLVDGKRHGYGTERWPDGRQYVGQWHNGTRHGLGMVTWPNGQKYIGEWETDLAIGRAVLSKPDGSTYVGQFLDSQRDGMGTQTYANGASYTGAWKDDHPEGWGVICTGEGKHAIGRLELNQRHGHGVLFFENGERDDNNRIYWDEGELLPQADWFVRDNARQFEDVLRSLGMTFSGYGGLTREEKLFVVWELYDDWVENVPGMRGIGLSLVSSVLALFSGAVLGGVGKMRGVLQSTQVRDDFCRQNNLNELDRARLAHWAEWSVSAEQEALVDCLRRALQDAQT